MLVIAQHDIQDPTAFWTAAQNITSSLPPGLKVVSVFPSKDMMKGTCIWEGPSVNDVQNFLDNNVGNISKNFCYEIDEATSMGLPITHMQAAAAN